MANENTIELVIRAKELASQAIKALTQAMGEIPAKGAEVNAKLKAQETEANQFVAKLTNDRIKLAEYEKEQKLRQLYEYYKQGLISTQQYQAGFKAAISQAHESAIEPSFFSKLKSNWLAVTGAIVGAWVLVSKAIDYIKLGAAAQQAETSFKQVTAAYGENADKLLAKMKEVSHGTIDDSNMMQRAVKGLQQGLSGDQIVKILEISRTAARVAGTDIESAFDGMTNAIANQQLRALKQYGIIIDLNDVFEKYAQKIGATKDVLTEYDQTQAIYNAVVEEGARQTEALGNMQMDAKEKIQKAGAASTELKETIGKALMKAVEIATAGFYELLAAISYVSAGYFKVDAAISTFLGRSEEAAVANKMAALSFEEANKAAENASNLWSKATGELDDAAAKEKDNAEAFAKIRRDATNEVERDKKIEQKSVEDFIKIKENEAKTLEALYSREIAIEEKSYDQSKRNIAEYINERRRLLDQMKFENKGYVFQESLELEQEELELGLSALAKYTRDRIKTLNESTQKTIDIKKKEVEELKKLNQSDPTVVAKIRQTEEEIKQIRQHSASEQIQIQKSIVSSLNQSLNESEQRYKQYTDRILDLQDKQKASRMQTVDKLRALDRKELEMKGKIKEAYENLKDEAEGYGRKAKEALEAGNYEEAMKYAEKAGSIYESMGNEVKDASGKIIVSQKQALDLQKEKTKEIGDLKDEIYQKEIDQIEQARQKETQRIEDLLALTKTVNIELDKITNVRDVDINTDEAMRKIDALLAKLDKVKVPGNVNAAPTGEGMGMSGGGFLSGIDTGRDYIPVIARGGEYFHPPESVKYYGLAFMDAVRRRSFPKPLADLLNGMAADLGSRIGAHRFPLNMAEGGSVPKLGSYDLNLNIGGERVTLKGDEFNVQKLITILRREQKQRGN